MRQSAQSGLGSQQDDRLGRGKMGESTGFEGLAGRYGWFDWGQSMSYDKKGSQSLTLTDSIMWPPMASPKYQFVIGLTSVVLTCYLCDGQPCSYSIQQYLLKKKKENMWAFPMLTQVKYMGLAWLTRLVKPVLTMFRFSEGRFYR